MADKRVVAVAAGAGLLGLAAFAFADSGAPAKTKSKARPFTSKERAVALAVRFARLFGVPPSLPLAVMAAGGWREKGYVANSRGGAWGFMFMTLATANDLSNRFPVLTRKYWPGFKGTGPTLQDPETNIAIGIYQLSLQWKKFRQWMPTALAYYAGSGRMDTILKSGGGRLPATLPADVAREKAVFDRVRKSDQYVRKSLANEGSASASGATRPKEATTAKVNALAEKIESKLQARQMLGTAAVMLNKAYPVADTAPLVASWAGLRVALHSRIDNVNAYAQRVYKEVNAASDLLSLLLKRKVALATLQASDVFADVDEAVNDPELSFLPDFTAAIRKILEGIGKIIVDAIPGWAIAGGLGLGGLAIFAALKK